MAILRNRSAPIPAPAQPMPVGPLNRNSGVPVPSGVPIPARTGGISPQAVAPAGMQPMPRAIPGVDALRAQAQAGQLPARTGGFGPSQPMPIGPLNRNSGAPVSSGVPIPAKMKKGGSVKSSASSRADGCAQRGKTRGRVI